MRTLITCFLLLVVSLYGKAQNNDIVQAAFPNLQDYPNIRDFTLSNSGDEAYITIQSPKAELSVISRIERVNNKWSQPQTASFSGIHHDLEPFLSPDNLTLYFASSRSRNEDTRTTDYDIWYVKRKSLGDPWEKAVNLGKQVNSEQNEFYPSVAANNNIYFTSDRSDAKGKDDIFFCRWNGQAYEPAVSLGKGINTVGYEFNAYVSPSESFLIFSGYNREDGLGSADLYISRKRGQSAWTKAINFGSVINSNKMDYCPFVDVRNKILYFTSQRSSFDLDKARKNTDEFLEELNKYDNGFSRLYKIGTETIFHMNE